MAKGDWWRHGVFYQIYPRSFQDSNGDGIGDIPGIISRLDHLNDGTPRSLGIDAIWLSPHYPSPNIDIGYDVADYTGVHPEFGTLADFDRLLAECHRRNIRLIVDLVPNHTSDRHPWFVDARASRTSPKRDWYVWADPKANGAPPNNWRSAFPAVGPAWTLDRRSGQYYLHHFAREQPDLNWWNPRVAEAFDEIVRFWLDRGVDGFRIDVAHGLVKDRALRDNPGRLPAGHRRRARNWDRPEVHDIHRRWRRILDAYGDRMAVGEVYLLDVRRMVRYYGQPRAGGGSEAHADARGSPGSRSDPGAGDELHLAFNFWFLRQPWRADAFRKAVEQFEHLLPHGAWPNYTLSNHDHSRTASRYDEGGNGLARARVAAMMLLTLRGTPFLYYGEEIGMRDVPIPGSRVKDRVGVSRRRPMGRDPARTPMQWDGWSINAGFGMGRPWLPVAPDFRRANVADQREDPSSMLSLYGRLIWFRKGSAALRSGSYRSLRAPAGIFAYLREAGEERLVVALNFQGRACRLDLSRLGAAATLVVSTDHERDSERVDLGDVRLRGNEGVLLRLA